MSMASRFPWKSTGVIVMATALIPLLYGAAMGGDLIDRRDEARGAFLAGPAGIYHHYCSACHGADGKGGGRLWATEISPPPADLSALEVNKAYLLDAIRKGSGARGKSNLCPPWGRTIPPDKIERLAQYILSLSEQSPQPADPEASAAGPVREASSWPLIGIILAEAIVLGRMLIGRKKARKNS